ncbi:MAG: hypothetical protein ACAH80_15600 [Alphaproteobacteria bacterium]
MSDDHHKNWNSDEKILTQKQAYMAMYNFLNQYWERGKTDELAILLGAMSLTVWKDGGPGDPAYVKDWDKSVKAALASSS